MRYGLVSSSWSVSPIAADAGGRSSVSVSIESLAQEHADDVLRIYRDGIETGDATFEMEVPSWPDWEARHLAECRYVAVADGCVVGWAALSSVSHRRVYRGVAEVSVYVDGDHRGQRVGSALLSTVVEESERLGIWTLQAGVFPENESSIALHMKHGFREVGRRERIGKMGGVWRDVIFLERRSSVAGQD